MMLTQARWPGRHRRRRGEVSGEIEEPLKSVLPDMKSSAGVIILFYRC
jgi:hypothetical protein